tara:strand:- start:132 stop:653 length:522 start_codon:yes stop_codon:yes gene_type:complete
MADNKLVTKEYFRNKVEKLEKALLSIPHGTKVDGGGIIAHGNSELLPLKHSFSDGIYVREMFLPAGTMIIGKIHIQDHTFFVLSGKILIITEDKEVEYTAPCYVQAPAGAKRIGYALKDTRWVNIYKNPDNIGMNVEVTDDIVKQLEDQVVVDSFDVYDNIKKLENGEYKQLK